MLCRKQPLFNHDNNLDDYDDNDDDDDDDGDDDDDTNLIRQSKSSVKSSLVYRNAETTSLSLWANIISQISVSQIRSLF